MCIEVNACYSTMTMISCIFVCPTSGMAACQSLGFFFTCALKLMHAIAWVKEGGHTNTVRKSALKDDPWKRNLFHTREMNVQQQHAGPNAQPINTCLSLVFLMHQLCFQSAVFYMILHESKSSSTEAPLSKHHPCFEITSKTVPFWFPCD